MFKYQKVGSLQPSFTKPENVTDILGDTETQCSIVKDRRKVKIYGDAVSTHIRLRRALSNIPMVSDDDELCFPTEIESHVQNDNTARDAFSALGSAVLLKIQDIGRGSSLDVVTAANWVSSICVAVLYGDNCTLRYRGLNDTIALDQVRKLDDAWYINVNGRGLTKTGSGAYTIDAFKIEGLRITDHTALQLLLVEETLTATEAGEVDSGQLCTVLWLCKSDELENYDSTELVSHMTFKDGFALLSPNFIKARHCVYNNGLLTPKDGDTLRDGYYILTKDKSLYSEFSGTKRVQLHIMEIRNRMSGIPKTLTLTVK